MVKYIKRQDACWKQAWGYSGETSLNLSLDILDFLTNGMVLPGERCGITFSIFKKEFELALNFIESQLPLYISTSKTCELVHKGDDVILKLRNNILSYFGEEERMDYTVNLYYRRDGRIYLNGLRQNKFSIRDYLVENSTAIEFLMSEIGYSLHIISSISDIN